MRGSTFQRCGCRDAANRQLGSRCPRRRQRGHGGWWIRYDAPRDTSGRRRQVDKGPFPSKREAEAALADVLDRRHKGTYVGCRPRTDLRPLPRRVDGRQAGPEGVDPCVIRAPHRAVPEAGTRSRPAGRPARPRLRRTLRRDAPDRPHRPGQAVADADAPSRRTHRHQAGPPPAHTQPGPHGARHRPQRAERGGQAAQDRAQPGALRRAGTGPRTAGAGLDRRTGRPVAAHRPAPRHR